jgi:hypothetical protein
MALIFCNVLTNSGSDTGQYRCAGDGCCIINEAHMRKPQLREGDEKDSVWSDSFDLTIPDVGKIQGQKSRFDFLYCSQNKSNRSIFEQKQRIETEN